MFFASFLPTGMEITAIGGLLIFLTSLLCNESDKRKNAFGTRNTKSVHEKENLHKNYITSK